MNKDEVLWKCHEKKVASLHDINAKLNEHVSLLSKTNLNEQVTPMQEANT